MFINNDTDKEDYKRFTKEREAASDLRVAMAEVSGYLKSENPEVSDMIQKALDKHKEERQQYWF